MASRALLIQSSTSTIVNYTMQTILLPIHTLHLIEKANRGFWGDDSDISPEFHFIARNKICQLKDRGGL